MRFDKEGNPIRYFIYKRSKTKEDIVSAGLHHGSTEITKVYLESFGKGEIAKVSSGLLE